LSGLHCKKNSFTVQDSLSEGSISTDEEADKSLNLNKKVLPTIVKTQPDRYRHYELDSRAGLLGSHLLWSYQCLFDEVTQKFFIHLGEVDTTKFSKTVFMNLVSFAEKAGATSMVLVLNKDNK